MFSIGDFATLGRVSVRMLRHYDAIGLLRPAVVDPVSGYRYYRADQLHRLNRVIALKDLGFTLEAVAAIVDDQVDVEELQGMLRLRRAQLDERIAADQARLNAVGVRLRMIEREGFMPTDDVVLKAVDPVRVAALGAHVDAYESDLIGPVIQPLYGQLAERLQAAGVTPIGYGISFYDGAGGSEGGVTVHAGMPVAVGPAPRFDFEIVDLPALPSAATLIYRGSPDGIDAAYQTLARWMDEHGYRMTHHSREVMLEWSEDPARWVNEIQIAVEKGDET